MTPKQIQEINEQLYFESIEKQLEEERQKEYREEDEDDNSN